MASAANENPEMTPEKWAIFWLFMIALVVACCGYGAPAIVIAIMAAALRISRAIKEAAIPSADHRSE